MRCQDNIYGSEDTRELLNPTFRDTGVGTRANIVSNENLSDGGLNNPASNPSILGKIQRWFTDLQKTVFAKIGNAAAADPEDGSITIPGIATLDANGHVPASQLPSYVDDVLEGYVNKTYTIFYKNKTVSGYTPVTPAAGDNPKANWWYEYDGTTYFRTADTVVTAGKTYYEENATYSDAYTPETGKVYVDLPANITFRWSGSKYVPIGSDLALGETSGTAYRGDRGKSAYDKTINNISFNNTTGKMTVTFRDGTNTSPDGNSLANIQVYAHPIAFIHFGATAPLVPASYPLWIDTANGYILKVYDGTNWIAPRSVWGG